MKRSAGLAVGLGLVAAVGVAAPGFAGGNKYAESSQSRVCGDDSVDLNGPDRLWPPNHKMVDEYVVANGDAGENVSITIMFDPATTVDAVGGDGGSQHNPDFSATSSDGKTMMATGTDDAVAGMQLRAERSGKGEGRTYVVTWSATFPTTTCSSSSTADNDPNNDPFLITVPHDMRGGADWK